MTKLINIELEIQGMTQRAWSITAMWIFSKCHVWPRVSSFKRFATWIEIDDFLNHTLPHHLQPGHSCTHRKLWPIDWAGPGRVSDSSHDFCGINCVSIRPRDEMWWNHPMLAYGTFLWCGFNFNSFPYRTKFTFWSQKVLCFFQTLDFGMPKRLGSRLLVACHLALIPWSPQYLWFWFHP